MGGDGGDNSAAQQQQAEEARKEALRGQINTLFGVGGATPQNFTDEENTLSSSLRGYYGDEQKKAHDEAERQLRFGASNTGNIGSTTYADAEAKLADQNRLGGIKMEEAVQRAVNGLRSSRENTRLNSINLVNSGSGADAVNSAASGLKDSFNAAQAGQREDLASGLFQNLAFTKKAADSANQGAQLAQLLGVKSTGNALFPTKTTSGTVYN